MRFTRQYSPQATPTCSHKQIKVGRSAALKGAAMYEDGAIYLMVMAVSKCLS